MRKTNNKLVVWMFRLVAVVLMVPIFCSTAFAQSRKLKVGDQMPEFSAVDSTGAAVNYKHRAGKVMVVSFLAAGQKQSIRAGNDLKKILLGEYEKHAGQMNFCVVTKDPSIGSVLAGADNKPAIKFNLLLDKDFELWGLFGVIANPTVLISDKSDTIVWIGAGYSYDFLLTVKRYLGYALGLNEKPSAEPVKVETLKNKSLASKIQRHIRMAGMLEKKRRYSTAIEELSRAAVLDPNSVDVALAMGQLYCKTGKGELAIKVADGIKPQTTEEQGSVKLILGWAKRQLGLLDEAEGLLAESVKLSPKTARAYFELGKVYQEKGNHIEAAKAYRHGLEIVLGED
jgi:tetratricopeptide (TPR) repeat protein